MFGALCGWTVPSPSPMLMTLLGCRDKSRLATMAPPAWPSVSEMPEGSVGRRLGGRPLQTGRDAGNRGTRLPGAAAGVACERRSRTDELAVGGSEGQGWCDQNALAALV